MDSDELTMGGYFSEFAWHSADDDDGDGPALDPFGGARLISTLPEADERNLARKEDSSDE